MRNYAPWLLTLAALMCAQYVPAQAQGIPRCPVVTVSCPDAADASPLTFSARVSDVDPSIELTFKWTASAGVIISGQGTSSVIVDASEAGGQSITATVEVGGLPAVCVNKASCSTSVFGCGLLAKMDEYGNISFNDEKARLDNFASAIESDPGNQGYIIAYAGRRARTGEAEARGTRARNYLLGKRGIDARRIVVIDGGHREELTVDLYVVPTGTPPPTSSPTVDPSEVQIVAGKTKARRRGRN